MVVAVQAVRLVVLLVMEMLVRAELLEWMARQRVTAARQYQHLIPRQQVSKGLSWLTRSKGLLFQ